MKKLLLLFLLISSYSYGQILTVSATDRTIITNMDFVSPSAGTQTFHISCAAASNWTLFIDYLGEDSWVTLNGGWPFGTGPADITVDVDPNPSFTDSRYVDIEVNITLTSGSVYRYIRLTQAPSVPTLTLSDATINVDASSTTTTTFTFTSDTDWTVTTDTWISLYDSGIEVTYGSDGTYTFTLLTSTNVSPNARVGTITFTSGSITKTLSVTQAGAVATGVTDPEDDTSFKVYPNPSQGSVYVDSNTPTSINVFNATGNIVYTSESNTTHLIQLTKGLYFLTAGNRSQKIVIE